MGKTRDLFKKSRHTKGTFHAQMGSIKDRNGMDLTEAEDIKKRWQEYTEELLKKDLHKPDNHDGVITHLEPDILECEVKWALGNITRSKASGGDGIPVELFQILKENAVKVLHSIYQQIWKPQQWPQDWKRSVFIRVPKKGNAKECSNYHTIALISHASKIMLKFLQARLQRYVNCEFLDVQAGFRKSRGTRDIMLKSRDITLPTNVHLVKAMVFPVVMYGCESWTIKKVEHRRIDAFELWCWRRLLRVPWTARRSNESILKEISPEYSLEGLMLKLKLQYFFHLM